MNATKALLIVTVIASALAVSPARSAVSIVSSVGGAATGAERWNLDSDAPAGVTVTLVPDAAFVTGSQAGLYAAPFLSGSNGAGFGGAEQSTGVDQTRYLTTGSRTAFANASITISFASPQQYFGLLWGSVDTYNRIEQCQRLSRLRQTIPVGLVGLLYTAAGARLQLTEFLRL